MKFAESSEAGGTWAKKDFLEKYFLLFFLSNLSVLKVKMLEANN